MSKNPFKKSAETLRTGEIWLRRPVQAVVQDELLIRSEVYNANEVDAVFYRMEDKVAYVRACGIDPGPAYIVCKAKQHCILPTSYFIPRYYDAGHAGEASREVHLEAGETRFIRNYGDQIGKNNILPSSPEVRVRRGR